MHKLENVIHTKGFVYENEEVIYVVKVKENNYIVDIYDKINDEWENEILKIKKIEEHKFKFVQLPPLWSTEILYDKNYNSIIQALNAYTEFMENY